MGWCFVDSATRSRSNTEPSYRAFRAPEGATEVVVPEGERMLGYLSFEDCKGVISVEVAKSVSRILGNPLNCKARLESITVAKGNRFFDSRGDCNAIINKRRKALVSGCMNTVIPETVEIIGKSAFEGCVGLKSIIIPDSVTVIERAAFQYCTHLTSLIIPKSVLEIGKLFIDNGNAFSGCPALESIIVSKENKNFDSRKDCNAIIDTNDNALICGCKNTIIPDTVKVIAEEAFSGCSGLTSISIPDSVEIIRSRAFYNCQNLKEIRISKASRERLEKFLPNELRPLISS